MKKKIIILTMAFMLLTIPAAWLQLREGVMLDGRFLARRADGLYTNGNACVTISPTTDGADITIALDNQQLNVKLTVVNNRYSFVYEDGRSVEGYAGKWTDELADADGAPLWLQDSIVVTIGNEPSPSVLTREFSLSNTLYHMVEGICEQRGHVLIILIAALIYALGIASFFWPEEVHFFGSRWRYSNAELSAEGIIVQKISGAACAIVSIVLLFAPLFW